MKQLENIFSLARKKWGGNGSGSTPEKTKKLTAEITKLIGELGVKSILDFGCGRPPWLVTTTRAAAVAYYGVDVVGEIIDANIAEFPDVSFVKLSEEGDLPRCDLVFVRDTFAHLSHATVFAMLERLKLTGATWLLSTSHTSSGNTSIKDGGFRPLNLTRMPFNFPEPKAVIDEGFENKMMMLWRFDKILLDVAAPLPPAPVVVPAASPLPSVEMPKPTGGVELSASSQIPTTEE